jgi:hypothetical protein
MEELGGAKFMLSYRECHFYAASEKNASSKLKS